MKISALILFSAILCSCASKPTYDDAMLEKYPKCYHMNIKIYQKCIQKNESGTSTTALDIENAAYPGQYK